MLLCIYSSIDKYHISDIELKKPDREEHILYDSLSMKIKNRQKQVVGM
jgi:hypothetical protein